MAQSHGLREDIDAIVRERLVRDGAVHSPAASVERLVSRGYTNAEKKEQLEAATGERIAALEAVGAERAEGREAGLEPVRAPKGANRGLGL